MTRSPAKVPVRTGRRYRPGRVDDHYDVMATSAMPGLKAGKVYRNAFETCGFWLPHRHSREGGNLSRTVDPRFRGDDGEPINLKPMVSNEAWFT